VSGAGSLAGRGSVFAAGRASHKVSVWALASDGRGFWLVSELNPALRCGV